jgi:hypothetical protein
MNGVRQQHTSDVLTTSSATLVLVAGGADTSGALSTTELYDPTTGRWTPSGSMHTPRIGHRSVVLANGQILVAGGYPDLTGVPTATAETYINGGWAPTRSTMVVPRANFALSLLADGTVLATGGAGGIGTAELFSPANTLWSVTGSMNVARTQHTSTLLANGKVLVAGGTNSNPLALASAELYDPGTGFFTLTGSMASGRYQSTAVLLTDGRVLVAGGNTGSASLASAELYDPSQGNWSATGSMATARSLATATLLTSGKVLIAGGDANPAMPAVLATAEVYDPATGSFASAGTMATARESYAASLLPSGLVLVSGGFTGGIPPLTSTAELFNP